jgi:hypothetical protein
MCDGAIMASQDVQQRGAGPMALMLGHEWKHIYRMCNSCNDMPVVASGPARVFACCFQFIAGHSG